MPRWVSWRTSALDLGDGDRIDAGERLVEQHEDRIAGDGAGDLGAPPLAARQRQRVDVGEMGDAEFVEQRVEPARRARLRERTCCFEHGEDVALDAQAAKDRGLLRQIADAEPAALEQRQPRDGVAVEPDLALVGLAAAP